MRDLDNITSYKCSQNKSSNFNQENHASHGIENVSIIIVNKKRRQTRKKHNVFIQAQQSRVASRLSRFSKSEKQCSITKPSSIPELNKSTGLVPPRNRSGNGKDTKQNKHRKSRFLSNFIVNLVSEYRFDECLNPFNYPRQTKFKIYRCQLGAAEDTKTCCCSCNSDAMFEVMKSLYDCYKKKNCENCNCILCGHLQREDRVHGEKKKSLASLLEQEKLLRAQAMKGLPLPEGKTTSEKELINKVRTDLGLPIEPKTKAIRDKHENAAKDGKLLPLEGKTSTEKENILQDLHDMGIPLPVGRTPSEKTLIAKIMDRTLTPSEQMQRAKAEDLLTTLENKTPEQKEKILKALANRGIPFPEGRTPSEKELINKVRANLGLPIEPKNKAIRDKHAKAAKVGLLQPLKGKTPAEKEKILQGQHNLGIPLPIGQTLSEKSLIAKIVAGSRHPSKVASVLKAPSEKILKAKAEGVLTTLKDKTPIQKEQILKRLANQGIPLPEGKSPSEKKLINRVRADLGLPIEPKTKTIRDKHSIAAKAGLLQPLEGKTSAKKEKILKGLHDMGIPLPKGRTPSEKSLIVKIAAGSRQPSKLASAFLGPSEQMRSAKAEGLLTPLTGKSPEKKEKILKALAMKGLPLPEDQSPSEKKLINKVRADLGLPKEPKTKSIRDKHEQAAKAGLLQPLDGKTPAEKENILKAQHDMGIPLPERRTPSEKALIAKVKASSRAVSAILAPSEQMRRAKAEGLLTTLKDKTPEDREKILKALANRGISLPEGQSPSEKKLIDKVRADLGLPIEPKTKAIRDKHDQAALAGFLFPLEGKTPAQKEKLLRGQHNMGIPLPVGRTPSEKSQIANIAAGTRHPSKVASAFMAPSQQMRRAKLEGLLTPLKDKTPEQREKILRALANRGIPLPEGQSYSEKKLIDKVRADLGLPIEPKNKAIRNKHEQAALAGLLLPLEGKTPAQKEKLLRGQHNMSIPLPIGRTPSEKSLIAKIASGSPHPSKVASAFLAPSEQMRRAKAVGLLTPLTGKTPEKKEKILKALAMKGLPLPEGQSPSEKKLIDKVRADVGLPKEPKTKSIRDKHEQAAKAGLLQPLDGKTPAEKEKILKGQYYMGIPLPEGRTPSEKALIAKVKASSRAVSAILAPSEQMRRAKAEGLLTTLKDKTPEQREKILRALANRGIPLPEGQSYSEKKLIDKVRADLGLPIEPKNKAIRNKHEQAALAGLLLPLEGKTPAQKEKLLRGQHNMSIPLPIGRTPSEKSLIAKIASGSPHPSKVASAFLAPSEQMRRAKAEGLLTPLTGKSLEKKEKILKALAMKGLPLPEGQSPSEKKLIDKVRADIGLPKEPKTKYIRDKHEQAAKAGLLQPLDGKTPAEKQKILKGQYYMGIPLPEGRTPSEKALIAKVKALSRAVSAILAPSEQMRRAKAEGLLTTLKDKTPEQREKILRALANRGIPLPEGQSYSEKKLIDKVRADLGLPIEPKNKGIRNKHEQAALAGLLLPLEGKTPAQKEKLLRGQHNMGIPLPVGRTPSEKSLIAKVTAVPRPASMSQIPSKAISAILAPSEHMRRAKAEGLVTPLKGKTPEQRENILKALAMRGIPLPEVQSLSEKKLIDKVRTDLGVPVEPKTKAIRDKHEKAALVGLLFPLEGKTPAQKEKLLRGQHNMGIPLPVGRTPSEKSLIAKIAAGTRLPSKVASAPMEPSGKIRKVKSEGLLTPLKGKTPEQKEKILKALAVTGLPLPEGQSPSEKKLIDKVRTDLALLREPKTKSMRDKHEQAAKASILQTLEGKTPTEKEKILKGQHDMAIPLPEGRTPLVKALIAKVKASSRAVSAILAPSEQMRRAKAEGLLTPLKDKTPEDREKILKALANNGIPLPEGQSPSEKKLIDKVRADLGLPIEPKTKAIRDKHDQAALADFLLPLEGKTPAQKEKLLRGQHNMGIPLPVGRTPSEKSQIANIAAGTRHPSKVASAFMAPSQQMRRAKLEGLLTPLKDKTPEQREKILRALAMRGIPLPESQSPTEKKLINKVRADLGLPIEPKTKSIRDKHEQAAIVGKLLPLEGKTLVEKEKILQDLHDMSIPLPVGRTASEKSLIERIMTVPKGKAVGVSASKRLAVGKESGIATVYEDVLKTTTCDRSCGCDKKKIRFKHSYVKIRITSPDISSFCDCPGECIPGIKSGAFIDNEGIKVTVGRAVGIPSFTREFLTKTDNSNTHTEHKGLIDSIYSKYKVSRFESGSCSDVMNYCLNSPSSVETSSTIPYITESEKIHLESSTPYEGRTSKSDRTVESLRLHQLVHDSYKRLNSKPKNGASSLDSVLVIKSEMSLCSTSTAKSMDTVSLMSSMDISITSNSTHYSSYQFTDNPMSNSSLDEQTTSDDFIDHPATIGERKILRNIGRTIPHREYTILRMSQTKLNFGNNNMRINKLNSETEDPIVLFNQLPRKRDVSKIMDKLMCKKGFLDASAIFIVVPISDDNNNLEQGSFNYVDSIPSIHSTETGGILNDTSQEDQSDL